MGNISQYWINQNKTIEDKKEGKIFNRSSDNALPNWACAECCNKDRETDCDCYYKPNCPYCLGTGTNLTADNLNS